MKTETITISKKEYARLKRLEKIDCQLLRQFRQSLEDVKVGRIRRVA